MDKQARIYVAGHRGMVGSALIRELQRRGYTKLITRTSDELDLCDQADTREFFADQKPEYVFLAAARVGGIWANNEYPAEFIYQNLAIQQNVIDAAWRHEVKKLLFLGSSCIYPKRAPQPLAEEFLLTGPLEPTNQWYAVAKIAGIKLCQAYRRQYGFDTICAMPTNLYGPNDNFDLKSSHVLPALIRKVHEAKTADDPTVTVWGSGQPRREFLHVDDLARACLFLMAQYSAEEHVNVGTGQDLTIRELAELICDVVGYSGEPVYDTDKPDGTPRKVLDVSRLQGLGWAPSIALRDGIQQTYEWYLNSRDSEPR